MPSSPSALAAACLATLLLAHPAGADPSACRRTRAKKTATIARQCDNRLPVANAPFCCRTAGNECVVAADRDTCATGGGRVQEGMVCGAGGRCDPVPGSRMITWLSHCPRRTCGPFPVATLVDLSACVQERADEVVDGMLCQQLPGGDWPCPSPPSGASLARTVP